MLVSMTRSSSCATDTEAGAPSFNAVLRFIPCSSMVSTNEQARGSRLPPGPSKGSRSCSGTNMMPATRDNVRMASGFPHCGIGTDRVCPCFQAVMDGVGDGSTSQNVNTQDGPKGSNPKGRYGASEDRRKEGRAKALVAARDAGKRCARSQGGRVQTEEREEDRVIAQAVRGAQLAPQDGRLPLRAVDADLLYQSRRQDPAKNPTRPARACEGGVEASVRQGIARR